MKKILVLVGEGLSANGICANAVMEDLSRNGYKVICITNQEFNCTDSEVKNGINFKRIKPRLTYRINTWCSNNRNNLTWLVSKMGYFFNKIKLILSIPTWPLVSPIYTFRFYRAAKKEYIREEYDCIISIYTQIDTVIAGNLIKKVFPKVKFVPYFLDSLSGGYGPKLFSRNWTIKRGLKWERKLLKNADKIIVMKSSMKHHEKYSICEPYYSRIKILDIPLLVPTLDKEVPTKILDNDKINIVYIGSIPFHIRNPEYMLEIFKKIDLENCVFTIIGTTTHPDLIRKAQNDSKKNQIVVFDPISHDEAINVMKKADILVNLGNNLSSMVPSKIFEYMSMGKPILSTYPIEDEPSLKYLSEYPISLCIKEDWSRFEENVLKVKSFIKNSRGKQVDFDELKERLYDNTPHAFVREINEIVK